jgi:hypothetical protein
LDFPLQTLAVSGRSCEKKCVRSDESAWSSLLGSLFLQGLTRSCPMDTRSRRHPKHHLSGLEMLLVVLCGTALVVVLAFANPPSPEAQPYPPTSEDDRPYPPPSDYDRPYPPPSGYDRPYPPPQGYDRPYPARPPGENRPYPPPQRDGYYPPPSDYDRPYPPPSGYDRPYPPPQ